MNKYPSVTIRIDQDLLDAVTIAASDKAISRSRLIIEAINLYVDAYMSEELLDDEECRYCRHKRNNENT
jgi:metal-responsive CopG/Arc/MetJ family transcriptional regulator